MHAWDLAVATGQADPVPPADAAALVEELTPVAAALSSSGMFAAAVAIEPSATPVEALLALTGRNARASG